MKNLKRISQLFIFAMSLTMYSCLDYSTEIPNSTNAKSMNELMVPSNFKWRTSQTVTVDIIGRTTATPTSSTLLISGKSVRYYAGFHLMSQNQKLILVMPSSETELTLKFGASEQKATIKNGVASFTILSIN